MSLRDLEDSFPGLLCVRPVGDRPIDWSFIRSELGVSLPSDFMALAEAYPPFSVDDFLVLNIPTPGEEQFFVEGVRSVLDDLMDLVQDEASHDYVPFPEPGGLLPWGSSFEGDNFYWYTRGEPRSWTVVVAGRNDDWFHYRGGMTSYLAARMGGRPLADGLPPDFPSAQPVIRFH